MQDIKLVSATVTVKSGGNLVKCPVSIVCLGMFGGRHVVLEAFCIF